MTDSNSLNANAILKRLGGNRALLQEVIEIFLEEGPRNLEMVRGSIAGNDPAAVRLGSHTLKGALSYFGIAATIELADRLEKLGRSGKLDGAAELFPQLENQLQLLLEDLKRLGSQLVPTSGGPSS